MIALAGAGLIAALTLPAAVFAAECVMATTRPRRRSAPRGRTPRVAVLMPAHDEEATISETIDALSEALGGDTSLLVVADNCTDRTAEIARYHGARVLERREPARRGKGYAIEHGMRALAADPPDVVVILDADCEIDATSLSSIASEAHRLGRPVQAEYTLAPADESALSRVGAFAFTVRNRVRARGLARMGAPIHLTGTGMAFPFGLLRDSASSLGGHLAEDLLLGLKLALEGHPPVLAEGAEVKSALPASRGASRRQRARWEGGSLALAWTHSPRLLRAAFSQRRPSLLLLALDLSVPPLALLASLTLSAAGALGLAAWFGAPLSLSIASAIPVALLALGVGVAWWSNGRSLLPLHHLAYAPLYIAWKIPLYVALAFRGAPTRWERTARRGE